MNAIPLEYKTNEIVNNYLVAVDKFMPEMHLKQPGFTYSVCGPYTKNKERTQKFKETGDTKCIYRNELDEACFQHDMVYGDFEDLARRAADPKYSEYQRGLAFVVYKFFDKKSALLVDKSNVGSEVNAHANNERPLDLATQKLAIEIQTNY